MRSLRKFLAVWGSLAVIGLVTSFIAQQALANHQPADKVAAAGSTLQEMQTQLVAGQSSRTVTLLRGTLKSSSPTDLIFQVSLECALVTNVTTVDNASSESVATVRVWVELDGKPVLVSSDDTSAEDQGRVTTCNRAFKSVTSGFDELQGEQKISLFNSTKSTHSFNWIKLNVGSAPSPHVIEVKAKLIAEVTGTGQAEAAVGKRTLIVSPEKLANDASI